MTDITEILKSKDNIDIIKRRIASDTATVIEWTNKLQKECLHPTTKTSRKYCSGGYDYLSSVTITIKCSICDKALKIYDDPNHKGSYS
jgi:hypothetical protein